VKLKEHVRRCIDVDDGEGFPLSELEHDKLCMSFLDDALARNKRGYYLCD
jgi:hypothetical protein